MGTVQSTGIQILIDSAFETLKELFRPNMSLNDIAEKYSPRIDEIILQNQKEGFTYTAGKFKIVFVRKNIFCLKFELYFQDVNKKWHKVANSSEAMNAEIWLSPEARLELQNIKEKVFDVESPDVKSSDKGIENK